MPNERQFIDGIDARPIRDLYYLRVGATGISFLLFGVFGVLLGILVVPLLLLLPGNAQARQARIRALIRLAFRSFVGFMNQSGGISYAVAGAEKLGRPGQLVIANHPSLIDIVLLIAFVPGACCVVKRAAWRNPSMMIAVHAAGYIPNSPPDRMIESAAMLLAEGQCVIMFPEGTRTIPYQTPHFHRGAASIAVRAARTITPVFIDVRPAHLSKRVPWYRVPVTRPHYSIRVGADIDPLAYRDRPAPIASRALNELFKSTYATEVSTT
jgi:1-acyl-sn-glycerol-3-phosphate acyltransferase